MKKQTLLFWCFSLLLTTGAFAQLSIGINAAYGHSWQDYGDDFYAFGRDLKIDGYTLAVSIYYDLSSNLSVGMEPGITRRGSARDPGFAWRNIYVWQGAAIYNNYVQLPLLLRGQLNLWQSNFFLSGKVGGGPAYMVSGHRQIKYWEPSQAEERQDLNFKEEQDLNRWDFGGYGGLGLGYRIGPGAIQVEANYYYGLMDANDQLTSKNRSLLFGLGYTFRL
ncbi:MAG: hypothetical protein DHS20C18_31470 [Saprospiraceae bacterium]|nr:MAG: hypothetical protein DHS20C18_31470 [Saprospiraceae bacterium]